MPAQTEVFTKLVRDYMSDPPVVVDRAARCSEMLDRIRDQRSSSAVVVDGGGSLLGVVTEQDICRRLALLLPGDTPVVDIMSQPVWKPRYTAASKKVEGFNLQPTNYHQFHRVWLKS